MAMKDLIEEFLNYLSVERGLSDNTINAYRRDLYKYAKYLEEGRKRLHFDEVDKSDIRDYMMIEGERVVSQFRLTQSRCDKGPASFFGKG